MGEIEIPLERIGLDGRSYKTERTSTGTIAPVEDVEEIDPFDEWFNEHVICADASPPRACGGNDSIKQYTSQGLLSEGHLVEISKIQVDLYFSHWLTTQQAWAELADWAVGHSVRQTRDKVGNWKKFIDLAKETYQDFSEDITHRPLARVGETFHSARNFGGGTSLKSAIRWPTKS